MKSNKQRRAELKAARLKKAMRRSQEYDPMTYPIPECAVEADQSKLVTVGTMALVSLPIYYLDKPFKCMGCGVTEVWTAKQQKWWYEIAQGAVETTAVKCKACRKKARKAKLNQQEHMREMANRTPHPNEAFFKN